MKAFLSIFIFAWFEWNVVYGIQSTILADLKRMEQSPGSHIPSKVKRAQEVVMFGNQQNKLSDHNSYVRADKRDIPSIPVPDVQNNLDKDEVEEPIVMESVENPSYQQLASLRSKFFYDRPDIYDIGLYEDRQKRNINKRSSLKRSDRIFRNFAEDNNRIKRESQFNQLNPEDVLSLLAMLESESRRKQQLDSRRYGHEYEPYSNDMLSESENEDGAENADWLDGPVLPSHRYQVKTRFYPPYSNNLIPTRTARRYKNNPHASVSALCHSTDGVTGFGLALQLASCKLQRIRYSSKPSRNTHHRMETNERSIQIPEFTDKNNPSKRQKVSTKPLFKMKIADLQSLEHDPDADGFKFKNHDLSLVMCGGKITDIFRDDNFFSFELDDGSGTISCFHKFKYNREDALKNLCDLPTSAQFLQTSVCPNLTRTSDETVFNVTKDNTVVRNLENDTSDAFRAIVSWFREEIVEKPKSRNIGDSIHVVGHLIFGDGIRKINVVDFRMATSEDREDLALEIDFLNRCVY